MKSLNLNIQLLKEWKDTSNIKGNDKFRLEMLEETTLNMSKLKIDDFLV